jgi:four helix bundle protein
VWGCEGVVSLHHSAQKCTAPQRNIPARFTADFRLGCVTHALHSYQDLRVWQAGVTLVEETYLASRRFPSHELYGLTSQIRRAAVSVPANIAEGYGRAHRGDYLRYLSVANGSLKEWETEVVIAGRLGYITEAEGRDLMLRAADLGRMLRNLRASLRRPPSPRTPSHPHTPTPGF